MKKISILFVLVLASFSLFAQPINDNCANAIEIIIPNNGYATGVFYSDTISISNATMQVGETVPAAIFVAGQDQKSIWYKFRMSTNRQLRVSIQQPSAVITAGDVGLTVYKTSACVPTSSQLSNKLTPISTFGNSYHPCVDSGEYLVQVTSKSGTLGSVYLELEIEQSYAIYDERDSAYQFGVLNQSRKHRIYTVDCHSMESIDETCLTSTFNLEHHTKTTWHTFVTPAYYDYIAMLVASGDGIYFTNSATNHVIGYKLYEGNARTTPLAGLNLIEGCDTFSTNGYLAFSRTFFCGELDTNKTYSLQLFFHKDFNSAVRVGFFKEGVAPSKGPVAATGQMHVDNQLGTLAYGSVTRLDNFSCISRHATNPCGNTKTTNGIIRTNNNYNLSSYFTFSIAQAANVQVKITNPSGTTNCKNKYVRLFNDSVSNNCNSLDTLALYDEFFTEKWFYCLPPGNYTIQVMGTDDLKPNVSYSDISSSGSSPCFRSNFGQMFQLNILTQQVQDQNKFSLFQAGAFDSINSMQPLAINSNYLSVNDTFGCANSVLPGGPSCDTSYKKAMYREFVVADSGVILMSSLKSYNIVDGVYNYYNYRLFQGDANALAQAQNAWNYPDTFSGLIPYTPCFIFNNPKNICIVPDTYTLVTFGNDGLVGKPDRPQFNYKNFTTNHYSQATVENMGSLVDLINNPNGGYRTSSIDYFSCLNNAVTINGFAPCAGGTKAIYRQFYLSQPAFVNIQRYGTNLGNFALFSGNLSTSGLNGLTNIWACFSDKATPPCQPLDTGWYTIVQYARGSSYDQPIPIGGNTIDNIGTVSRLRIYLSYDCLGPKYNRPHKAAVDTLTNNPFLIEWNAAADTGAYPVTGMSYILPKENFNCTLDTPFSAHPITTCNNSNNRVAYYTFQLTQESYVLIHTGGNLTKVYNKDVRVDSMLFATLPPLQNCTQGNGKIEICKMQPGIYTLVVFMNSGCTSITPTIDIDKVGLSRFDHANNAYDFGIVPPDNTYYDGKVGDINPLNPQRAASNDFIYCTTGARSTDPDNGLCRTTYNANVYSQPDTNQVMFPSNTSNSNIIRRNLWYTFQVNKPGWVSVKVNGKTPDKTHQLRYVIYKSDVDGTLPFSSVVTNGLVDSTLSQGLSIVATNHYLSTYYCDGYNKVSFFIPPCDFSATERYYILIDNRNPAANSIPLNNAMRPNHQVEVAVMVDSISPSTSTLHDYYSTAGDIGTIGADSSFFGPEDNFTCATASPPYPSTMPACGQKTIWYKFTVANNVTGLVRIGMWLDSVYFTGINSSNHVRLYREAIVDDSTSVGLKEITTTSVYLSSKYWRQSCVSPGTYYIVFTGCDRQNENVYPEVFIEESPGDFCEAPLIATISGPGISSASLTVNCHTIGSDYGEFAPTLSCPPNGLTKNYKSSWFRMDITGTDTLDITTYLSNNTNAASSQIQYRMMSGNCNAMQEQSCVLDAQTQNTYQCMIPGNSYYIQVFVPKFYNNNNPNYPTTGTVTLNLNSVSNADTCMPFNDCIVNASFIPEFNCTVNDSALFVNYSTYGSSIEYLWDFGYNNASSTEVSPRFRYPGLATNATYTVNLRVINTICMDTSFATQTITIPPRPEVNLGNDTVICVNGSSLLLNATSHAGATYLWHNNSTSPTFLAAANGTFNYRVAVKYAGCTVRDTIAVFINPVSARPKDTIYICSELDTVVLNSNRNITGVNYLWNTNATNTSISANSSGWYWSDLTINGCTIRDSFLINLSNDTFSVLGNDTSVCIPPNGYLLNATTPGATSYLWSDSSTSTQLSVFNSGIYWVEVKVGNCNYVDSVQIDVSTNQTIQVNDTICYGNSYQLPSNIMVNTAGTYYDTLLTAGGCDSILITFLEVRDSLMAQVFDTVCSSQLPYLWNNISVTAGGNNAALFVNQNSFGCDSSTVLNLLVSPSITNTLNASACSSLLPYTFGGHIFTQSGMVSDTLQNMHGCDSITHLNFTALPSYLDSITAEICFGNSYLLPSNIAVNTSGTYYDTLTAAGGCDSVFITVLAVKDTAIAQVSDTICSSQLPYIWNNITVSTGGNNAALFVNQNTFGCDSTTILNLVVSPSVSSTLNGSACSSLLPYNFGGHIFTQSGMASDTFLNTHGCDSIVHLNFTALPAYFDSVSAEICFGNSYLLPSNIAVNTSGTYYDTLLAAGGCDSVFITVLAVRDTAIAQVTDTICSSQLPYIWNNISVSTGGNNAALFLNQNTFGCDSTTILNLVVSPSVSNTLNGSACSSLLPYTFGGHIFTQSGIISDTFLNTHGCDSLVHLSFTVLPSYHDTLSAEICEGSNYVFDNNTYNTSGYHNHPYSSSSNCDSNITVHLIVHPIPDTPISAQNPIVYCKGTIAPPLSASGSNLLWYNTATGGTGNTTAPIPNTSIVGTLYYYVSQTTNGCEGPRIEIEVIVHPSPTYDFDIYPLEACEDEEVTITVTSNDPIGGLSLTWNFDNGTVISQPNPNTYQVSWSSPGNKVVTLSNLNVNCPTDTITKTIFINPKPETPDIDLPDFACVGQSVKVKGTSNQDDVTFVWTGTNNQPNANNEFDITWQNSGMKHFSLYTTSAGCSSTIVYDSIWISDIPEVKILTDNSEVCQNDTIHLRNEIRNSAWTYSWSPLYNFPNGLSSTNSEASAIVIFPGYIYLEVTNEYECKDIDSIYVTTIHCCDLFVPNAFSPNNDGLNDKFDLKSEVNQTIKQFSIYNRYGQRVFYTTNQSVSWDGTFNGKQVDQGVYFYYLIFICSDGTTSKKKGEITLIR